MFIPEQFKGLEMAMNYIAELHAGNPLSVKRTESFVWNSLTSI